MDFENSGKLPDFCTFAAERIKGEISGRRRRGNLVTVPAVEPTPTRLFLGRVIITGEKLWQATIGFKQSSNF